MKNMKNKLLRTALSLVTACLLVLAILPQRAEAAGASLSGSSSVQAGNSVTLTLSVDSKILGLTADLNCGDGLTFTNYSCSVSGWSILVNQNHFSVYGTNSASGGIITVTLKVSSSVQGGAALFQNRTLLNEPARPRFSLLDSVPRLRFFQAVLCLQQFLLCICHKNPSSLSFLPDDLIAQSVGKLDSLDVSQGLPLELV